MEVGRVVRRYGLLRHFLTPLAYTCQLARSAVSRQVVSALWPRCLWTLAPAGLTPQGASACRSPSTLGERCSGHRPVHVFRERPTLCKADVSNSLAVSAGTSFRKQQIKAAESTLRPRSTDRSHSFVSLLSPRNGTSVPLRPSSLHKPGVLQVLRFSCTHR